MIFCCSSLRVCVRERGGENNYVITMNFNCLVCVVYCLIMSLNESCIPYYYSTFFFNFVFSRIFCP